MSSEIVAKLFSPAVWQHMRADFLPFEVIPVDHFRLLNKSLFSQRRFLAVLLLFASGVAAASESARSRRQPPLRKKNRFICGRSRTCSCLAKEWLLAAFPVSTWLWRSTAKLFIPRASATPISNNAFPRWQITKFRIGSVSKPLTSALS